jgi:hypothetical protein
MYSSGQISAHAVVQESIVATEGWLTQPMLKELLTGAIGSLMGALGRAYGAQLIADRKRLRETIRMDVVRTNTAIEHTHTILNKYLNLKEQFTRDMVAEYKAIDAKIREYEKGLASGAIPKGTPPPQLPQYNMFTMSKQKVRIDRLEGIIMDELTIAGEGDRS